MSQRFCLKQCSRNLAPPPPFTDGAAPHSAQPAMINGYFLLRAFPFLAGAFASMLNTNAWVEIMVGPDAWDYSPKELGVKANGGVDQYGFVNTVRFESVTQPLAQAVRYSTSGVGVHLAFIGIWLAAMAFTTPRGSKLHAIVPLSLLALDALTVLNATGSLHSSTMGHPRCATVSFSECAKGLGAFAPVVVIDLLGTALGAAGIYPSAPKAKAS